MSAYRLACFGLGRFCPVVAILRLRARDTLLPDEALGLLQPGTAFLYLLLGGLRQSRDAFQRPSNIETRQVTLWAAEPSSLADRITQLDERLRGFDEFQKARGEIAQRVSAPTC